MTGKKASSGRWFFVVAAVFLLAVVVIATFRAASRPTPKNEQERVSPQAPIPRPSSNKEFALLVINPAVLRIADAYPVPSIREMLQAMVRRVTAGQLRIAPDGSDMGGVMGVAVRNNGVPTVMLLMPRWRSYWENECAGDIERLDDELTITLLHELYHLDNHRVPAIQGSGPSMQVTSGGDGEELVQSEAECWAFTIKDLFRPMRLAGRKKGLVVSLMLTADKKLAECGDNAQHPEWKKFIRENCVDGAPGTQFLGQDR